MSRWSDTYWMWDFDDNGGMMMMTLMIMRMRMKTIFGIINESWIKVKNIINALGFCVLDLHCRSSQTCDHFNTLFPKVFFLQIGGRTGGKPFLSFALQLTVTRSWLKFIEEERRNQASVIRIYNKTIFFLGEGGSKEVLVQLSANKKRREELFERKGWVPRWLVLPS